ncbi:hypothetical protein [Shewanella glacialipiscicola]|uniref:hypothetical protein n=1 Tax=Shewanella glacialipiscicola TaxID=614069 RepID=UPI003D7B1572
MADNYLEAMMEYENAMMEYENAKDKLENFEKIFRGEEGFRLNLASPNESKILWNGNPNLIDEDFLLCEVLINKNGYFESRKINSRLDLWSVTESRLTNCNNMAQLAIDHTDMWFNNNDMVVATGHVEVLEERSNQGFYKLRIQIVKWRND